MSNLTNIDNKINELLLKAKLAIFGVLDKTTNIKQLLIIDDEMTKIILQLDELTVISERKFRIMRIQSMQDIIDFIIKNKDKYNDDLLNKVQIELNLLLEQNNNQKEKINFLLEQNKILENENNDLKIENERFFKNIGGQSPEKIENDILSAKINLLLEKNDILRNDNDNMSKNISYQLSKINNKNISNENLSDLLKVEQLKNAKLNDGIRNKNIQIEELKNKSTSVYENLFGEKLFGDDLLKKEQTKNVELNKAILNKNIQIEKLNNLIDEMKRKMNPPSVYDTLFGHDRF